MKCDTCQVKWDVEHSDCPACCKWFLDNVVIDGDSVENCTDYEEVKK